MERYRYVDIDIDIDILYILNIYHIYLIYTISYIYVYILYISWLFVCLGGLVKFSLQGCCLLGGLIPSMYMNKKPVYACVAQ